MTPDDWPDIRRRYENHLVLIGKAPSTVKQRLRAMERLLSWHGPDWRDISSDELAGYLARPEWTSVQTRRTFQASMTAFFGWAFDKKLIEQDPSTQVPKVSHDTPTNPSVPASREAIRTALENADDKPAMMVKLAYVAGLKTQEIAQVHSDHVFKDDRGQWFLRAHRLNGFRDVPLPASLADELRVLRGYQFPGLIDGHLSAAYVSKLISAAMPGDETAEQVRLAYKRVLERNVAVDVWRDVGQFHSPVNLRLLMYAELRSSEDVQRHLDHISREIEEEPGAAIDNSKRLLESLFKLVMADLGQPVRDALDLPDLYRKVETELGLDTDSVPGNTKASEALRKTLRTLVTTVFSIAELRNSLDGHGRFEGTKAEPIHARLAFNATVTVAEFVATRWAIRTNRRG